MSRLNSKNARVHTGTSVFKALTEPAAGAPQVRYRILRLEELEDRLALSAAAVDTQPVTMGTGVSNIGIIGQPTSGSPLGSPMAPTTNGGDLTQPIFLTAYLGTPLTISLPFQLTAGHYQLAEPMVRGQLSLNDQGQLVYTPTEIGALDVIQFTPGSVDSNGNPLGSGQIAIFTDPGTSSTPAPWPAQPDVDHIGGVSGVTAYVGTQVTIQLPTQSAPGQYQIWQGAQYGTATLNDQGQLTYTATAANAFDSLQIRWQSTDNSANPFQVDVTFHTLAALTSYSAPLTYSVPINAQADQATISDSAGNGIDTFLALNVFGAMWGPSTSAYWAQISTASVATGPQNGTITEVAPWDWVYTPNAGYTGNDQVTFNVHMADPNAQPGDSNIQYFDGQVTVQIQAPATNSSPANPTPSNSALANPSPPPAAATAAISNPAPAAAAVTDAALVLQPIAQSAPGVPATVYTPATTFSTQPAAAAATAAAAVPVMPLGTAAVDAAFAAALAPDDAISVQLASPLDAVNSQLRPPL